MHQVQWQAISLLMDAAHLIICKRHEEGPLYNKTKDSQPVLTFGNEALQYYPVNCL